MKLRPATAADAKLLFDWVNSPSSLAGKIKTNGAIAWADHTRWFEQRLRDPHTAIWIGEDGDAAVGQVRLQKAEASEPAVFDVDIFVADAARRKGCARELLTEAARLMGRRVPGARLRAQVRDDNKASQELFQSLGYRMIAKARDHLVYLSEPTLANAAMPATRSFAKSDALYQRALKTIPLATQTFSKSAMNFVVGAAPLFLERGDGGEVWDVDGNSYIDYILGLLPVLLGYRDPDVDRAIVAQLERGISFSLATELESEVAELLVRLIPSAEMVRFGKNGSDATTAAIRLARAITGRDLVAACGYHGWHDWYIGTTTRDLGVPKAVQALTKTFAFNDAASLDKVLSSAPGKFAAVILEPTGAVEATPSFLKEVRELASRHGALLVFDEIITGFRVSMGGAQKAFGVTPDLSCFGKAMANGMPISAIVGPREHRQAMEAIFFSGTFGGEALSLAAARATIEKCERLDVPARLDALGRRLMATASESIDRCGLSEFMTFAGSGWWPRLVLKDRKDVDKITVTSLIRQETAAHGLLMGSSFNLCLSHDDPRLVNETISRWQAALLAVADALDSADPAARVRGVPVQPVFKVRN